MSYFNHICFSKAPQLYNPPGITYYPDMIELCYLAAVVEEHVDSVTMPLNYLGKNLYREFDRFLKKSPVDLVCLSSMTCEYNQALILAKIAKKYDKYVVMGGYHPTALYKEVLESPYVDAVVVGEGEETLKELITDGPSRKVSGLAFKDNEEIVFNGFRSLITDLDAMPFPLRRIRPNRFGERGDDYTVDTVYTSRGCPWKCTFCANDIVGKTWRPRSPEDVVEELSLLHDPKRKKYIKLWDANFLTSAKRIEKLCDLMIERGLTNFKLYTETSLNDIIRAESMLHKLRKVGLLSISLGIESPNEETLKLMRKSNKVSQIKCAIDILNKHNIQPRGFFIIGHYNETLEDSKKHAEYAESINLNKAVFMVMTPYPGTQIFREYEKKDLITSKNWDMYNNFGIVVKTQDMDALTLNKMMAYNYGRFFVPHDFRVQKTLSKMQNQLTMYCYALYGIFSMNQEITEETKIDLLFEFFKANSGETFTKSYSGKPPLLLRLFDSLTIRFSHSPGRNIDFVISHHENERRLKISSTSDTGRVRGLHFPLEVMLKLFQKVPHEKVMELSCKAYTKKYIDKKNRWKRIVFLADRELIPVIFSVSKFLLVTSLKTLGSICISTIPTRMKEVIADNRVKPKVS